MPIVDHFRKHGVVHLLWIIAILTFFCGVLMNRDPGAEAFTEDLAFASSVSSIVLAIVAIFYSMISNHGFGVSIGKLESSSAQIDKSAQNLTSQMDSFLGEIGALKADVAKVPSSVDEMKEHLSNAINGIGSQA